MRRQNLKPNGGVGCSTRVSYDAVYTLIRLLVVACLRDWFAATVPPVVSKQEQTSTSSWRAGKRGPTHLSSHVRRDG